MAMSHARATLRLPEWTDHTAEIVWLALYYQKRE